MTAVALATAAALATVWCLGRARVAARSSRAEVPGSGSTGMPGERRPPGWPEETPPWTAGIPMSSRAGRAWASALAAAGVDGDPVRWGRAAGGALGLLAIIGGSRGGLLGAGVLAAVGAGSLLLALRAGRGRGARRADALLPELLEHAGRNLRSGLDLVAALGAAADAVGGPHGAEVLAVTARVAGGASLPEALRPWEEAQNRPAVRLAVGALEVASVTGGARARALDGVAATLRSRAAVADEARALASQARASAVVLVALPAVVALLGAVADPRLAHTLLATPLGLACVGGAAVLDGVGAWWMQRIVARAA